MVINMPKMFCLIQMNNGVPDTSPLQQGVDYSGHVHISSLGGFGAYIISGTGPQLAALNALPSVVGIIAVTETATRWPELDGTVSVAVRNAVNTWLTNHGQATVGAGLTYRQLVNALYRKFSVNFDADTGADVS